MEQYALLSNTERSQALLVINKLGKFNTSSNSDREMFTLDFASLTLACLKIVFKLSNLEQLKKQEMLELLDPILIDLQIGSGTRVFVLGRSDSDDRIHKVWVSFLLRLLGGDGISWEKTSPADHFSTELIKALGMLEECNHDSDIIRKNTGLVLPFTCNSPESGSGTSKLLPGCLMLPSGVPTPMLAECWLHECLHTELYLAEWLSGKELAGSEVPLISPWRTVNRSANLLLHGCFVFTNVVKFIQNSHQQYASIKGQWHLSAAKGKIIHVSDVQQACDFRILQVKEALDILWEQATFSNHGKIVYDRVRAEISAL